MPEWELKNNLTGETITIESDKEPTQDDAHEIFQKQQEAKPIQEPLGASLRQIAAGPRQRPPLGLESQPRGNAFLETPLPETRVFPHPQTALEGGYNTLVKTLSGAGSPLAAVAAPVVGGALGPTVAAGAKGLFAGLGAKNIGETLRAYKDTPAPTVGQDVETAGDVLANLLMVAAPFVGERTPAQKLSEPIQLKETYAIPERSTEATPVGEAPGDRGEVGARVPTPEKPSDAQEAQKPAEAPVQAEVKQGSIKPTDLRAAINLGDRILVGKLGETHADILKRNGIDPDSIPHPDPKRGFVDLTKPNDFLNRGQAQKGSGIKGTADAGGLDSSDLPDFGKHKLLREVGEEPEPDAVLTPMGGDVLKELQPPEPQGMPSSNKNAVVDQERAQRGLEPMMAPLKQTFGEWWTKAMALIDRDPGYQDRLVSELLQNPRPLTGEENAALLHRRVELRNEYEKAARDGQVAYEDGNEERVKSAQLRMADMSDRLTELEQATGKGGAGTESGRSLAARKMMMNNDYSLASLEMQKRAAKGFEPLTDKERQEIIDLHNKLQATEKAYQDYVTQSQQRVSELESQKKISEIRAQTVSGLDKRVLDYAESIVSKMEKAAEPAAQRLRDRLSRLSAGIDPTIISDAAIVGSAKIARLGLDLAKWTDAMVKDFGEKIRPMLADIWKASNEALEERLSKVPETVKRRVKKQDPIAAIEDNKTRISDKVKKGEQNEISPLVQKLVRSIVERDPEIGRDALVDEVHGILKEALPDITRREAMDAISGYGDFRQLTKDQISTRVRDLKGQLQQVAKLEDIQSRKPPLKSGVERRTPSDEERRLIKQVNEAKRRFGITVTDPATQLKSALDARKTYYKNQISDLEAQIAAKERFVKTKTPSPTDPELESLKKQRDSAKAKFDELFNVRQETALAALKERLKHNIDLLQSKLDAGDFSRAPKKPPIVLDPEAQSLKAKNERLKRDFQAGLIRDRLKNRTGWEKALDWGVLFRRFNVLSSLKVIPKLISAGVQRLATLPLEEIPGELFKHVSGVSEIAKRAPLEGGGINLKAEMAGYGNAFTKGIEDAIQVLKTGKSDLDIIYGKPKESYTGEFEIGSKVLELPGRFHGTLKSPVKRAIFERSAQRLAEFYAGQGLDVSDPLVMTRIGVESYKAANRGIFLQDNFISSKVAAFLSEHIDPKTGHARPGSKLWSTAGRIALPITRVPINIVAETMQYAGGLASGSLRVANALRKGVENLSPEQADLIMRELKKGSIGAAVMAIGYFNADVVGGYYQPGEKRKPGDVKAGRVRVFGVDIPSWLLHNPLLETAQLGATIRRVADSTIKGEKQGLGAGAVAGALGVIEQVPFVRESVELEKAMDPRRRSQVLGEQTKSIVVPAALSQAAEWMDPADKRRPKTVLQHIESGIPILREQVPQ